MKHSEQQITDLVQIVLTDLGVLSGPGMVKIDKLKFHNNEQIEFINKKMSVWIAYLTETLFDSSEFLYIDDETGQPVYYRTKYEGSTITKSAEGKYMRE